LKTSPSGWHGLLAGRVSASTQVASNLCHPSPGALRLSAGGAGLTIRLMSDAASDYDRLTAAAGQLMAIESLLGAPFVPARPDSLPVIESQSSPAGQALPGETMTREQKADALTEMDAREVKGCTKCPLCKGRTNTVFGEGDPDADIVFIGEGPGADEDATGRPFVGRAGELLTKMIAAMGLSRQQVYIANIVKCRPPGNRPPAPDEVAACWDYLVRQLQIIAPKVIVTLGNPSTQALLDTRVGITRMRGTFRPLPAVGEGLAGIPVMPTFHPAYILRQYTPDNRAKVWSDLQQVMAAVGLPAPNAK